MEALVIVTSYHILKVKIHSHAPFLDGCSVRGVSVGGSYYDPQKGKG